MKTKEELNALKEEVETVSRKLHELTDEELEQVTGGNGVLVYENNSDSSYRKENSEGSYEGAPMENLWHSNSDAGAGNDDKIVVFP